ncbi:UNVERIFIED_CONTAM: hypothetical protein GTU68_053379 [Idotea baltica]|nr:hypothetical protein [Idotea baltica]
MIIGIPKETKTLEKRVSIIPENVEKLTASGHKVLIEKDAGLGSFFTNQEYINAGANIIDKAEKVWKESELIIKVKEPQKEEFKYLRKDLNIFTYLHLAGFPKVTEALIKNKTTSIAYELIRDDNKLVLLEPMSKIAGTLAVQNAAFFIQSQHGGKGILLKSIDHSQNANVIIIGAGSAGIAAAEFSLSMGANVYVFDIDSNKIDILMDKYSNINFLHSNDPNLKKAFKIADIVISAVLVPGDKAPKVITKKLINYLAPGSIIVDISIDQGGSVEGIKPTDLENPIYIKDNILFYAVQNMPSQAARTSSIALSNATIPYIIQLSSGIENNIINDPIFKNALCTHQGDIKLDVLLEK